MLSPNYLILLTLRVLTCVHLSSFPCLLFSCRVSRAPDVFIGDTNTWLLHLLFLQMSLLCCNVYSYSPAVSTQLCINVTLAAVSLGCRRFGVRSVMLSEKNHLDTRRNNNSQPRRVYLSLFEFLYIYKLHLNRLNTGIHAPDLIILASEFSSQPVRLEKCPFFSTTSFELSH